MLEAFNISKFENFYLHKKIFLPNKEKVVNLFMYAEILFWINFYKIGDFNFYK